MSSNSGTGNIPTVVLTNAYNSDSQRTQQTATVSGTADFKNTSTYDNAGRLSQVKQEGQSGGNTVAAKRVDFTYNTGGLTTGIKRYNDTAGTQNVANTTYTYDLLARVTALDHKNASGTSLASYSWTFDVNGRVTNITNPDGTSSYTYDADGQVTVVDHSYQTDEAYSYDANGNRTNTGYTTTTNNRVTSDGTYNYTYDDEGNRTSRTKISDNTKVEYTWDYRNRLTDVVYKNASGTVTLKIQYTYDVFNRRIGKKLDTNGDGTYDSATYWAYDNAGKQDPDTGTALDDIVLEFTDADGDGSGASTLSTRYLHGPAIDQILASETVSSNVVNWALSDNQGTVRDIARYASGTTTIVNHRKYDAFGNVTAESDPTVKFLYWYTGREWDGDAGLYYERARWYDPRLGRFILEDPLSFNAGDTNLNRYVRNSPANGRDPSGYDGTPNTYSACANGNMVAATPWTGNSGISSYNANMSWMFQSAFYSNMPSAIADTFVDGRAFDCAHGSASQTLYTMFGWTEVIPDPGIRSPFYGHLEEYNTGRSIGYAAGQINNVILAGYSAYQMLPLLTGAAGWAAITIPSLTPFTPSLAGIGVAGTIGGTTISVPSLALIGSAVGVGSGVLGLTFAFSTGGPSDVPLPPPRLSQNWQPRQPNDPRCQFGCENVARQILRYHPEGQIVTITPPDGIPYLGGFMDHPFSWYFHQVVVSNGRVYDAFTGSAGMDITAYKLLWECHQVINFGF
jgi:RHS repeat-associated protein